MEERMQLPRPAIRYLDGSSRTLLERVQDLWFAPKRFESTALYERLGVRLIKRYVPTGGDFFIRRYGVRIATIRGALETLIQFERHTRRLEAIHELAFLGFLAFSFWRALTRQTTFFDFGFAVVVYVVLILSPAMLQRYNRLRVYPVIRRMAASQMGFKHEDTG
jgi:Glycosyl-4,4'-diaponeurosporenoate acyltransferase